MGGCRSGLGMSVRAARNVLKGPETLDFLRDLSILKFSGNARKIDARP